MTGWISKVYQLNHLFASFSFISEALSYRSALRLFIFYFNYFSAPFPFVSPTLHVLSTWACHNCHQFFRLAIRGKRTFVCKHSGSCHVSSLNKVANSNCGYCRLKGCLKAGMKKEKVGGESQNMSLLSLDHRPKGGIYKS